MMERLAFGLFALGLGLLSYLYGVASTKFELFPYEYVHDAWSGGKALYEVWADEFDRMPPGAISLEPGPARIELAARDVSPAGPGRDLILVIGGPYKLTSECPELGCLAWIMDRQGTVYHAWPLDRTEPWGELGRARGFSEDDVYPSSLHLYDNGDLLVSYHVRDAYPYSVGMAKFDKDGKLLWKNAIFSHHDFYVDENGMIYAPSHKIVDSPLAIPGTHRQLECEDRKIYEDLILVLAPDGTVTRRISVLQVLFDSGYGGLVSLTTDMCDPLHSNHVRLLTRDDAPAYPTLAVGDMLISVRNLNTIAILDSETARVKWITSGQTVRQHSPNYLGANDILAFDNLGGPKDKGGSRLAKINLATEATTTLFPGADTPPELNFFTDGAGEIELDASRERALVSLTLQGRGLEIDLRTGDVLWEYDDVHDVTEYVGSTGEGEPKQYARFGLSGIYYVESASFLADVRRPMAAR
jgi:hypothetical protein